MKTRRKFQLSDALRERCLVRFRRRFEESRVHGYVLDIGPKFFLLSLVSDRFWFDGFECFRKTDVRELKVDPYARFAEAALKKRGERIPKKPRLDLTDIAKLLITANKAFPLTISREQIDPEVCWIGRVVGIEQGRVALLQIGPDAKWDKKPNEYRLNEITRVNFGGDYENALHLVGGNGPV